jgi:hypothetical protein
MCAKPSTCDSGRAGPAHVGPARAPPVTTEPTKVREDGIVRYLLAIYGDETAQVDPESPEFEEMMKGYGQLNAELTAAGKHLGGEPLVPTSMATTVRVRNDEALITDGPFAETKEQLGGFYMVEADDLDEAIRWASKIPAAQTGSIEVRPIAEYGEQP